MRYLLDSHVLLWWLEGSPKIPTSVREKIADSQIQVLVSAATIWEIGIKQALGKLRVPESLVDLLQEEGFTELPMSGRHAETAAQLPLLHRDPFDRMLVAQSQFENLVLVTHDEAIRGYDVDVLMV